MLIRAPRLPLPEGYTPVVPFRDNDTAGLLEFGLLSLKKGASFSDGSPFERVFLLLSGTVRFTFGGKEKRAARGSVISELPSALHAPAGFKVDVGCPGEDTDNAQGPAELAVVKVRNSAGFAARFFTPADVGRQILSAGKVADETVREIRTVLADETAPFSNMAMGEVFNFPGKWSSYPPHHHPHPEIYHYRFEPENGFGYAEEGDDVYKVRQRDTLLVAPNLPHPQTSAPGYAMVYVWAMPHLPGNRFGSGSRQFVPEHEWVL